MAEITQVSSKMDRLPENNSTEKNKHALRSRTTLFMMLNVQHILVRIPLI